MQKTTDFIYTMLYIMVTYNSMVNTQLQNSKFKTLLAISVTK